MSRRQWTLLLLTDDDTRTRQYRFSREVIRLGIALVLVAVSALSSVATTLILKQHAPQQATRLQQKNQLLRSEISEIREQVDALNSHLQTLARQDEQFRLVAGLEPLNADVQRVGIGGPGTETSDESELRKLDRTEGDLAASTASHVGELLRRAQLLSFSWREARDTLELKNERMASMPSIIPTRGYITSSFTHSRWHPILNIARPHEGIDISAPTGTPIVAAAKGVVTRAGFESDYGYLVEIDHGFGLSTRYAHASRILVRVGQAVKRGDRIALVGETGLAVGPHLHYEVLINGHATNPSKYFLNADVIAD